MLYRISVETRLSLIFMRNKLALEFHHKVRLVSFDALINTRAVQAGKDTLHLI